MEDNFSVLMVGWLHVMTSFPKYNIQEGKIESLVENTDKHHLRQVIRVNINSESHVDSAYYQYDIMRMALCLCGFLLPNL